MCEQQYFIEYVLGYRGPSNQKADKGTIVHKVLEVLAFIKKAKQDSVSYINDDILGNIDVENYNLEQINDKVYQHYSETNPHHNWSDKDKKDCAKWVEKAISLNNGMFDPRNRDIVYPEQHFDFVIDKEWANYDFEDNGQKISGKLGLKGTIDLITKIEDNFYEIIDWKTGRRLNWVTGKEKTYECLQKDPQLRIYHYAVSHLYPDIENIMITINFINDGGPYSICFQKKDLKDTERMIREKFEYIKNTKKPRLNKSWKCKKLCHFGKTTFENTNITPLEEYRDYQITPKGEFMTKCEQIHHDIQLQGMESVIQSYKHPNHSIGFYKPPGE
jgi:hypothetical protein